MFDLRLAPKQMHEACRETRDGVLAAGARRPNIDLEQAAISRSSWPKWLWRFRAPVHNRHTPRRFA
jgi:hypothetical protein